MIPISYNIRSLIVRKHSSAAAALGLALVVFVFAAVMMLAHGVRQATQRAADPRGVVVLRKGAGTELESSFDASALGAIAEIPGVAQRSCIAELAVLIVLNKPQGAASNVLVRGVPDEVLAFRPALRIVAGRAPRPGTDEAIIGDAIRGRFRDLELGRPLELRKNHPIRIVGVFDDAGSAYASEIWADANLVRSTFGLPAIVSSVHLKLEAAADYERFEAALAAKSDLGLAAYRESEFGERQTQGTHAFLSALGILITVLFSVGAMVGATITMHTAIAQRQREIGTLRAIGFSRAQILCAFLVEALLLAAAGGVLGCAASLAMAQRRISMLNTTTFAELSFAFEPTTEILVQAMLLAAAMGLVGGLFPALRATRIDRP